MYTTRYAQNKKRDKIVRHKASNNFPALGSANIVLDGTYFNLREIGSENYNRVFGVTLTGFRMQFNDDYIIDEDATPYAQIGDQLFEKDGSVKYNPYEYHEPSPASKSLNQQTTVDTNGNTRYLSNPGVRKVVAPPSTNYDNMFEDSIDNCLDFIHKQGVEISNVHVKKTGKQLGIHIGVTLQNPLLHSSICCLFGLRHQISGEIVRARLDNVLQSHHDIALNSFTEVLFVRKMGTSLPKDDDLYFRRSIYSNDED